MPIPHQGVGDDMNERILSHIAPEWFNTFRAAAPFKALTFHYSQRALELVIEKGPLGVMANILREETKEDPSLCGAQFNMAINYLHLAGVINCAKDGRIRYREGRHMALKAVADRLGAGSFRSTWEVLRLFYPKTVTGPFGGYTLKFHLLVEAAKAGEKGADRNEAAEYLRCAINKLHEYATALIELGLLKEVDSRKKPLIINQPGLNLIKTCLEQLDPDHAAALKNQLRW